MILVDANILLYTEDKLGPQHDKAKKWWDEQLSGNDTICFCWEVLNAFIRIGTNNRVYKNPLSLNQAVDRINSWLEQPCTRMIVPTENHWEILQGMLEKGQVKGNLVTDAHLAAMAVAHGCTLYSTDADFSRFPHLKWKNPIK